MDDISGLATIISIGVVLGTVAVAWGSNRAILKEHERRLNEKRQRVDTVSRELQEFKEKVARDYVSREAVMQLEERLVGAIERLGDRLDRLIDSVRERRPSG